MNYLAVNILLRTLDVDIRRRGNFFDRFEGDVKHFDDLFFFRGIYEIYASLIIVITTDNGISKQEIVTQISSRKISPVSISGL